MKLKSFKQMVMENRKLDDLHNYVGDSAAINSALRRGERISPEMSRSIESIDSFMKPTDKKVLYRAFDEIHPEVNKVKGLNPGEIYSDPGYASTTHSQKGLKNLQDGAEDWGGNLNHIMVIQVKHPVNSINIKDNLPKHPFANQDEELLARGTKLKKIGTKQEGETTFHHFETTE